jgi:hypothetical protein
MRTVMLLGLVACAAGAAFAGESAKEQPQMEYPQLTIQGDALKLILYLPDVEKGFYRGLRFDWSGLIARAEFGGHTVFGPFRQKHNPLGNDCVVGPAEEFDIDSPQGYAEAKPGGTFLKIGVGLLKRGAEPQYRFSGRYEVASLGRWKVTSGPDWVEFTHTLAGGGGWGYVYTKRIGIGPGAAFTIAHTLRNTGSKAIDTTVYCHNFIVIDGEPVGPNYRITFPFDLVAKEARGKVEFKGREIVLPEELKASVWAALQGGTGKVGDNQVTVENRRTGAGVKAAGDQPTVEWRFYAEKTAACPEPFIRIQAAPGEEKKWRTTYTFFSVAK